MFRQNLPPSHRKEKDRLASRVLRGRMLCDPLCSVLPASVVHRSRERAFIDDPGRGAVHRDIHSLRGVRIHGSYGALREKGQSIMDPYPGSGAIRCVYQTDRTDLRSFL